MEGLAGYGVGEANVRFRLYLISFMGVLAFGALLYWRASLLTSTEYVELPKHKPVKHNFSINKPVNRQDKETN